MVFKKTFKKGAFEFSSIIQEEHRSPLYCLHFNACDLRYKNLFATVGSNRATVYELLPKGKTEVVQCYVDENPDESFFSVTFTCDEETGAPLMAVAGLTGLIKILDLQTGEMIKCFAGHGNSINDLKIHSTYPNLILSASKDESVRLWNITTGVTVLIFAGARGHRNEVLSVDFHPTDPWKFVSCGMDNTIKIWRFAEMETHILSSTSWAPTATNMSFPTKYQQHPEFSTHTVHQNYVDCVRWLGNMVLSKSVDDRIVLWRPEDDTTRLKESVRVVQEYKFADADIWFMRFALDFHMNLLAVGNRMGKVFLWEANTCPPRLVAKLSHPSLRLPIRQTAISHDNNTVLCCCEDGSVVRWDRNQEEDVTNIEGEDVTNIEGEEAQGAAGPLRPAPTTNRGRSEAPEEEEEEAEEEEEVEEEEREEQEVEEEVEEKEQREEEQAEEEDGSAPAKKRRKG